jgi:DNA-binding NarL/FixJ family response regulator
MTLRAAVWCRPAQNGVGHRFFCGYSSGHLKMARKNHTGRIWRIAVVDDHPIICELLGELLKNQKDLKICCSASDSAEALKSLERNRPDLVILDLSLKTAQGIDVVRDIRARFPNLPLLVFSVHSEMLYAERAIRGGAQGYVCKQEPTSRLIAAIRSVLNGQVYVSEAMALRLTAGLAARRRSGPGSFIDSLTDRELAVFELLGKGLGTRDIARQLRVEMRTVETYRARIKTKLRLDNAHQLLQHAIRWVESGGLR